MTEEDQRRRRERFLRELASRDLYAWFGIAPDAGAQEIREAAERKRRELSGTPMPQKRRELERAFCDQGEKALLRPDIRREYDALLRGGARPAVRGAARDAAEREARLRAARERIQNYDEDDARMAPGSATLLASDEAQERLAAERREAAALSDAAAILREARAARVRGDGLRALAYAERARSLAPGPATLTTLGAALRDVGDLAGSEETLRQSLRQLPRVRENAPAWTALAATLRARGALDTAAEVARAVVEENEEDAHGWRAMAMVAADRGETLMAGEAWERSAKLGLDRPGVLAGLQALRKDRLAAADSAGAADVEARIARLRL